MQKGLLSIEFARIPPNLLIKFEEILNKQEIDHKTSFLIGFLLAKSGEKPEEMPSIYDFLINKNIKAISKLQEEEEKEFLEEKAFIKKAENRFCKRPLLLSEEKKESLLKKKVNTYNSNEKTKEIKEYEKESIEKPLEIKENDESLCDICFNSLFSEPLYLLDQCPHIYHVNCLKQYLTTQVKILPFKLI